MRTTITIDDHLLEWAKKRAHEEHRTLGDFVEEALQRHLLAGRPAPGPPLPVFTRGTGMRPGIDPRSNSSMLEAMEEYEAQTDHHA